ncbi:MAG: methyltransferase domain-containing protein [Candidatus Woesearchaeota archaeon]
MNKIVKVLISESGKMFYLRNVDQDYHCQYGVVKKEMLALPDGSEIKTNTGVKMVVVSPTFTEQLAKIRRGPQAIPLKDMAAIIAESGIGRESLVVDAGAGSGMLACFLARHAGKVVSYELREDFLKIASENAKALGLDNLEIKQKNIYEGIDEKDVDLITLDLPEPWLAIKAAEKALKHGGILVSYSPTIPQIIDMEEAVKKSNSFIHLKTIEIIEREWELDGRKVRPKSQQIGHSGFLSFYRKL